MQFAVTAIAVIAGPGVGHRSIGGKRPWRQDQCPQPSRAWNNIYHRAAEQYGQAAHHRSGAQQRRTLRNHAAESTSADCR
jgi:hypothetical protein